MFEKFFGGSKDNRSEITVDELHAQLNDKAEAAPCIVDVREPGEYTNGHISGARLIPLGNLAVRQNELPKDVPILLICRSGNRSKVATDMLQRAGYTNAANVKGGMIAWQSKGYQVEFGEK